MSTIATPAPEAPSPINHVGRLIGALFNPKPTFESIAARPSWIAPIALFVVLGLVFSFFLNKRMDWESYIRQQAEKNPRFAQLSEDQKQNALGMQVKLAPAFAYVFGAVGNAVFVLIMTLILWGSFNLFAGAKMGFGNSFGITAHAFMAWFVATLVTLMVMVLKKPGEVDPEHLLGSHLGVFLSDSAPKWLEKLASSFELFWIWVLVLLAVGFSAANPKKVSMGKSLGIVFGLWGFWVLLKVGWAAI